MPREEPALSPSVSPPEKEPYLLSNRPLTQGTAFCQPFVKAKVFSFFHFLLSFYEFIFVIFSFFVYFCAHETQTIVQSISKLISRFSFRLGELNRSRVIHHDGYVTHKPHLGGDNPPSPPFRKRGMGDLKPIFCARSLIFLNSAGIPLPAGFAPEAQ